MTSTAALRDAAPSIFWLDDPERPAARPPLEGDAEADLVVVGGGFTGLWTALEAREAEPGRAVVLLEGDRIASGASGRNGGFVGASLTHGIANGAARFPNELHRLEQLGRENLDAIGDAVRRHGIDAAWEETGELSVATRPHELGGLAERADALRRYGRDVVALDRDEVQAEVASPTYLGGVWNRDGFALANPARLAWGLAAAAERAGVRLHEQAPVTGVAEDGPGVVVTTAAGRVRARRCILATAAFPPLVAPIRRLVVPVYDYVLATERLSAAQRDAIGWRRRQGLADSGNRFHYYRLTADDRILWGGYDAVYHFGNESARTATSARRPTPRSPATSSPRSRSSRGSASRTVGAARSTRAAASASRSAPGSAGGSPTRSGSPGSASARAASARASPSTSSTAATPS